MDKKSFTPLYVNSLFQSIELEIQKDTATQDEKLKQKYRSINLIKYNPNLFTNKETGLIDLLGGNRFVFLSLGIASLFGLYRMRLNTLRQMSIREGIWMVNLYAFYGFAVGGFYSVLFFSKTSELMNEITAHYLMKRYKGSADITRRNIYQYKDIPNGDDCYNYSNKFFNHAH